MLYLIIVLLTSLRLSVRAQAHLDSLSAACIAISPRIECELVTINTKPRETHPRQHVLADKSKAVIRTKSTLPDPLAQQLPKFYYARHSIRRDLNVCLHAGRVLVIAVTYRSHLRGAILPVPKCMRSVFRWCD